VRRTATPTSTDVAAAAAVAGTKWQTTWHP